jgi:dienelactone hydrolase
MGVVDDMVLDASRVLDRLEAMSAAPAGPFGGRLALDRGVGYLGHSLGGAAAAWALQREPRVKAAVSWEGQVYRAADRPMNVTGGSLLYIIGGANRSELMGTQFRPGKPGLTVYEMVIHGAWHASFGDMLYIYRRYANRDWRARHRREVHADRVNQITDDYVDEFFAHYLLGKPLDLLWPKSLEEEGDTRVWSYPEVELRVYGN